MLREILISVIFLIKLIKGLFISLWATIILIVPFSLLFLAYIYTGNRKVTNV